MQYFGNSEFNCGSSYCKYNLYHSNILNASDCLRSSMVVWFTRQGHVERGLHHDCEAETFLADRERDFSYISIEVIGYIGRKTSLIIQPHTQQLPPFRDIFHEYSSNTQSFPYRAYRPTIKPQPCRSVARPRPSLCSRRVCHLKLLTLDIS